MHAWPNAPLVIILAWLAFSPQLCRDACAQAPVPVTMATIASTAPAEIVDGSGADLPVNAGIFPITFFDDFSWRWFVALNWPATGTVRGQADANKMVGDLSGPRVWETWKSSYETIPPPGTIPQPWSSFAGPTPCATIPESDSGKTRLMASFTKFGDVSQADFLALAGPLVCQNSSYAHYEIKVNQPEYEFIVSKKLYDRTVIESLPGPLSFTNGSVEVKAAWREFKADEPQTIKDRFYRIKGMVKNYATGTCEERELGLLGMHIVHKTPLRPQWVWSSFEHVDNVPAVGQTPAPGTTFSLNDPAKPQVLSPSSAPGIVTDANYLKPDGSPGFPVMQVIRELPIHAETAAMNVRYQTALSGTVWANYMLVMTQWPTDTAVPDGAAFPSDSDGLSITNTAMETYFQSSTSCMTCHDFARNEKLDFVFFPAVHAQRMNPGSENAPTSLFINRLRSEFQKSRDKSRQLRNQRLGNK